MKIKIIALVALASIINFSGCKSVSLGTSTVSATDTAGDAQIQHFVTLLSDSWVLSDSWDHADNLRADAFPAFYYRAVLLPQNPNGWDEPLLIPAKDFEAEIKKYFDVSTEHLRTVPSYNAAENIYSFDYGIGSGSKLDTNVIRVEQDITSVAFRQYDPADSPIREGEVQLKSAGKYYQVLSVATMEIDL